MDYAFQYIKENGGIDTEKSYPYEGEDDKCRYNPAYRGATDIGFVDVEAGNEQALKSALATQVKITLGRNLFRINSSLLRVPAVLLLMLVMRVSSSTTREFTERKNVAPRTLTTEFLLLDMVLMRDLVKLTGSSRTGLSS